MGMGARGLAGSLRTASFAAWASLSLLVGGSGGRLEGSNAGGNLRPAPSTECILVADDTVLLFRERDESVEISEAFEFRRASRYCV